MTKPLFSFFSFFLVLFVCSALSAHARYNPRWNWRTVRTEHFIVYYPEGHEAFARRVLALCPEVYGDISGYLGVKPDPVPIVLNPGTDVFNGFYTIFPNRISLFETPVSILRGFGSSTSDLMDLVFTHEYTHYAHITTRSGIYGALSRVFGEGTGILNVFSPCWMLEGVTTNTETLFTDGGRGRSPEFAGRIRSFTEGRGLWGLSAAGAVDPYTPPYDRVYLAGYHMVEYLNRMYGPDAFARVSRRQGGHPFRFSGSALRHVTGKPPKTFYREFLADFTARADSFRAAAASSGLPAGTVLLAERYDGFDSHFWTPEGTIRALRTGYGKANALVEIDPRTGGTLREIRTGNMFPLNKVRPFPGGRLLYGEPFFHPFGMTDLDTTDLVALDPSSGKRVRLTRGAHVFSAALSPDGKSIAATARNGMWIDLLLMDADGGNIRKLVSRSGLLWDAPSWSRDGGTVAAALKEGGRNAIALVDVQSGVIRTPISPDTHGYSDPEFSPDGRRLVFTSDLTGVWNVYSLDLGSRVLRRLTSVPWDVEEPHVSPDGKTLSFLSLARGLRQVRVAPFTPESGEEVAYVPGGVFDPAAVSFESGRIAESRGIPLLRAYAPYFRVPWTTSDEKGTAYGIELTGGDPVGLNAYSAQVHYGAESRRLGYDLGFMNRSLWPELGFRAYDSSLEGNTLGGGKDIWYRERGGEVSLGLPVVHRIAPSIITALYRVGARMRTFEGLERVRVDRAHDRSVALFGEFAVTRRPNAPPRDLVPGWGQEFGVSVEGSLDALGSELPGHAVAARLTQFAPSPLCHHGIALSLAHLNQSGRLHYDTSGAIPRGYESDEPEGGFNLRNVLTASLEYHFPLWYADRGIGMTLLHLHLLRGSLFIGHGAGWDVSFRSETWARNARTSVGATLSTQLTALAILPLDIGVAAGYKTVEGEGFVRFVLDGAVGGTGMGKRGRANSIDRGWNGWRSRSIPTWRM